MTLGEFRKLTEHLGDDTKLMYHAYYKGCCLNSYVAADMWLFPKDTLPTQAVVLNPGDDYDPRKPAE